MRLRYYRKYCSTSGRIDYDCDSDQNNKDGVNLLVCLLTDDGGMGRDLSLEWIEKGIEMIEAVRSGASTRLDWDCNAFGAKIYDEEVIVYSLYDESYHEVVSLASFRKALTSWRDFLLAEPTSEDSWEIVLED